MGTILTQSGAQLQAAITQILATPVFTSIGNGLAVDVEGTLGASGLQAEITSEDKLSANLINDADTLKKLTTEAERSAWNGKQDALTAGTNIQIVNNVISVVAATTPKLHAPTIALSDSNVVITPAVADGSMASNYIIFANGSPVGTTTSSTLTVDLGSLLSEAGTYSITVAACAIGFENSNASNAISYHIYSVSTTVDHGTSDGPSVIKEGQTATIVIIEDTGYDLPQTISVTGATYEYSPSTGIITLSEATGAVVISVECDLEYYSIATSVSNGTSSGATSIYYGGTATVVLAANTGYDLPSTITVSGNVTYSYDAATGEISLSNPTGGITITAVCVARVYDITKSGTNCTVTGSDTIAYDTPVTLTITPAQNYHLPTSVTVTGATYSYDSTAGTIVLSAPTANVSVTVVCPLTVYTIYGNVTNGQKTGDATIDAGGTADIVIVPDTGYSIPSSISVSGATVQSYNSSTGAAVLSAPTGDVTVTATCPIITYTVAYNITNGTASGSVIITYGGSGSVIISPSEGYSLPANLGNITITNATPVSYDSTMGVVSFSNPTGNVTIAATCPMVTFPITYNLSHLTHTDVSSVGYHSAATITLSPNANYLLPNSVTVSGDCSYSYDSSTGVISISSARSALTITASAVHYNTISVSVTNGSYSGDVRIVDGSTASGTITPSNGYKLPADIVVTNASYTYNASTGVISFSNPNTSTNTVAVTVVCPEIVQLATPSLVVDGDTLEITDNDGSAESFDLYVNDVYETNVSKTT